MPLQKQLPETKHNADKIRESPVLHFTLSARVLYALYSASLAI